MEYVFFFDKSLYCKHTQNKNHAYDSFFLNENPQNNFQIEIRLKSAQDYFTEFDRDQTCLEFLFNKESETCLDTESRFYEVISEAKQLISDIR